MHHIPTALFIMNQKKNNLFNILSRQKVKEDQDDGKEMQAGTDACTLECVKRLSGGWRNKSDIDEINKVLFTFSLCSLFHRRQIQNAIILCALTSVGNVCQKGTVHGVGWQKNAKDTLLGLGDE